MKRKLAVAVALVGGPSVVLLDEPSSGLDPGAQRNLWDLIKVTMKGRAVVLTTHSMGEADLLCDRVGIMVKGTMRCIGTPQELKERYAAGYEISCRLETRDDAHVADLVAFAREAFSSPDVDVAAADADASRSAACSQSAFSPPYVSPVTSSTASSSRIATGADSSWPTVVMSG